MPMSPPPELAPLSPRTLALLRMAGAWAMRLIAVGFGLSIEVHEVYGTTQAQWALVFLGLWFVGVPPALWFDGVWRLARLAQVIDATAPGQPPSPTHPLDVAAPERQDLMDRRKP